MKKLFAISACTLAFAFNGIASDTAAASDCKCNPCACEKCDCGKKAATTTCTKGCCKGKKNDAKANA